MKRVHVHRRGVVIARGELGGRAALTFLRQEMPAPSWASVDGVTFLIREWRGGQPERPAPTYRGLQRVW